MTYDETLARRIRALTAARDDIEERRMFGGLAFMCRGHMACGIVGEELMVRVGAERYEDVLQQKHVRPMDFTGRPLRGMVYVGVKGIARDTDLRAWIELALAVALEQPAKRPRPPAPPKPRRPVSPRIEALRAHAPRKKKPARRR